MKILVIPSWYPSKSYTNNGIFFLGSKQKHLNIVSMKWLYCLLKYHIEKRRKITFLPTVSYGSASFSCGDIVAVKDKADRDMYQYKYERKNRNGMV